MRTVSLDQLPAIIDRGVALPRILTGGSAGVPWAALDAVDRHLATYRLHVLNGPAGLPRRDGVIAETSFLGDGFRGHPHLRYIPSRLSLTPALFRQRVPLDAVIVQTSTPRGGKVSLGCEVNILPGAIEACRARGGIVVAQMNPRMPYTFGDGEYGLDDFDALVEVEHALGARPVAPASPPANPPPGDPGRPTPGAAEPMPGSAPVGVSPPPDSDGIDEAIGALVAERVGDGATLQMGIGTIVNAALPELRKRHQLRIWTEMLSDGLLSLWQAGCLDPDATIVSSFAIGSPELYEWLDGNEGVRVLRCETTNNPANIATNPGMTSINTALQVDLFDQANASRLGTKIYSGFGGQTDFTVGAIHAPGGQALMALRSWHPRANVSTIVPLLDAPVTSYQHTAVITEHGVAVMRGFDEQEQAAHLIDNAAHPQVRDELWEEARNLGLA